MLGSTCLSADGLRICAKRSSLPPPLDAPSEGLLLLLRSTCLSADGLRSCARRSSRPLPLAGRSAEDGGRGGAGGAGGGGGGGGGGGSGGSVYMTLRTAVSAEGQLQGEGAIEGSFRDYQVTGISSHGRQAFAYSQFNGCAAGEERK